MSPSQETPNTTTVQRRRTTAFLFGIAASLLFLIALELTADFALKTSGPHRTNSRVSPRILNEKRALLKATAKFGLFPDPPSYSQTYGAAIPHPRPDSIYTSIPRDYYTKLDSGPLLVPRTTYRSLAKTRSGHLIWNVEYGIDDFHRRKTNRDSKTPATQSLVLLGDSQIFGEGVSDSETLSAHLQEKARETRVYNYGLSGLYPGELLDRLRSIKGPPEIGESRGTALSFYANYHVSRMMGEFRQLAIWGYRKPYYQQEPDGRFVSKGTWAEERPNWVWFSRLVLRSSFIKWMNPEWPAEPQDSDWSLYIELLKQMRDEAKRLGLERFYVVLYPGTAPQAFDLIPYLEKAAIPYVDLSTWNLDLLTRGPHRIAYDYHLTSEAHDVIAKALRQALPEETR